MHYEPKNFTHLLGMSGFSDELLQNHFTLYEGYVKNTNTLQEKLQNFPLDETPLVERSELQRRFGWEYNGMKLHEYYFENMTQNEGTLPSTELTNHIAHHFGSFERWKRDFVQIGMMRGIGWVLLACDDAGVFRNTWVSEHDGGLLVSHKPVFVMDVFEHSYIREYGLKKASYIDAFFSHANWHVVEQRISNALTKTEI